MLRRALISAAAAAAVALAATGNAADVTEQDVDVMPGASIESDGGGEEAEDLSLSDADAPASGSCGAQNGSSQIIVQAGAGASEQEAQADEALAQAPISDSVEVAATPAVSPPDLAGSSAMVETVAQMTTAGACVVTKALEVVSAVPSDGTVDRGDAESAPMEAIAAAPDDSTPESEGDTATASLEHTRPTETSSVGEPLLQKAATDEAEAEPISTRPAASTPTAMNSDAEIAGGADDARLAHGTGKSSNKRAAQHRVRKKAVPSPADAKSPATAWWPEKTDGRLNLTYAGEASFTRAIALLFDGTFENPNEANRNIRVTSTGGVPIRGQWVVATNKQMLLFKAAPGVYVVQVGEGLQDGSGRAIASAAQGQVLIP